MRILFVYPNWPAGSFWDALRHRFPALGLQYIAALTPSEHYVELLDEQVQPLPSRAWSSAWDLVGVAGLTPQIPRGYQIADYFRQRGIPVVMGGPHVSALPKEALEHADAVVVGEAEPVWHAVLADAQAGRMSGIYRAERRPSLAGLPRLRRELLPGKGYRSKNIVITTRGCPFECEFCVVTSYFGGSFRRRPVEEVLEEIKIASKESKLVFIADDIFNAHEGHAKQLMREMAKLAIYWTTQVTINFAKDDEMLRLAADSNCWGVFIGLESLEEATLNEMGKSFVRLDTYKPYLKKIHSYGIGVQGSFVFGNDGDDRGVFERVLRFAEEVELEAAMLNILTPFPGTQTHHRLRRQGRIYHEDWSRYDMYHVVYKPMQMTPQELQDGVQWVAKRFYSVPSMLRRIPIWRRNVALWAMQNWVFRYAFRAMRHGVAPTGEPDPAAVRTPSPAEILEMGGYLHPVTERLLAGEAAE